jgi:hypothetical protein
MTTHENHEGHREPAAVPRIVDRDTWQAARDELLVREKAHTREGDAIAVGPPSAPDDGGRRHHHRGGPGRTRHPARPLRGQRGARGLQAHVVPRRTVREPVRGLHHDLLGHTEPHGAPKRARWLVRRVRPGALLRPRAVHRVHGVPPELVLHGRRRRRPRPRRRIRRVDVLAAPRRPGLPHQHRDRPGLGGHQAGARPARHDGTRPARGLAGLPRRLAGGQAAGRLSHPEAGSWFS